MSITFTGVIAMDFDRAIGLRGGIPWHISEDMRLFKKLTMGHPLLMGRKTYESLGRPLPGRQNIVLTRDEAYRAEGVEVIRDVAELERIKLMDSEVMVIGGAQVYSLLLPRMSCLHVSLVSGQHEADTYFPPFEEFFSSRSVVENYEQFSHVIYRK